MRMRKLPWAEEYLQDAEVVIKDPSQLKGRWRTLVHGEKLHLEIGCGKGDYWNQMAKRYPQDGWIAIEKNVSVAGIAVRKFDQQEGDLSHMRFIWGDAQSLEEWFDRGEIDVIHLNFSDPWPKKRAHKKRLSAPAFLAQYANILSRDGTVQMKTDNSSLFEFSILQFQQAGWKLEDFSVDYRREPHEEDVITEYEKRFLSAGQPIYRAVWSRGSEEVAK